MSSRKLKWAVAALIVALIVAGLSVYRLQQRQQVQTREAGKLKTAAAEKIAVEVAPVVVGEVEQRAEVSGTVRPESDIGVVSKIPGRVHRVRVDVGQAVRAGDVLVELERAELAAQVRQAEAAVVAARAGARQAISAAETQVQVSTGQYDSAQALLRQAQANLKSAAENLQRLTELHAKHAVTRQQLELAQTQADVARAQVESAEAAVESARSGLDGARRHLATVKEASRVGDREATTSEAAVIQAEAALELARAQLANATITAPVSGLVSFRAIDPGELASPGVPLVGIVSVDRVFVEVTLTENLLGKIKAGAPVQVQVDAFPDRKITGRIANLAPAADSRTRSYTARVHLDNSRGDLRPGMFATVFLTAERRAGVVVAPTAAIVDRNGQPTVFVVEGGRAVEREVTVGLANSQVTEIRSGLKAGEQIVVKGQLQLADGMAVSVSGEEVK